MQRGDQGNFFKNRQKSSPRFKGLRALWRKWHYPLLSIHLKCKTWRRFRRKQRLQKCPNAQVMAIFGRSLKTRISWKSAKGRRRNIFQKLPKKKPWLQRANSTLAQMSLSSNLYPLIVQRPDKILARKAAPNVPEWPSYGSYCKVTQNPHFAEKVQRGYQGKFFKNGIKSSLGLKGSKALWRKWHYPVITMHIECKHWTRFFSQTAARKVPEWPSYNNFRKVTQNPHFLKKCKRGTDRNFSKMPKKMPSS